MKALLKHNYDKLLLTLALLLAGCGVGWVWLQQPLVNALRRQTVAAQLTGKTHDTTTWRTPDQTTANWVKPAWQLHGAGWIYEVFTPPVIYYNTLAKTFTVTPPQYFVDGGEVVFGLELLAVKLELYRLQLVGYFGGPDNYVAAFVSPSVVDTLLAREGRRFDDLGLTLKNFAVKKVLVEHNDSWPVYDIAAQAVLQDEKTGAEVLLDSRSRKFTDKPLAVLRATGGTEKPREFHEGDTITDETGSYRIERIQLDPPEVVVARQVPGLPLPEIKILHPMVPGKTHTGSTLASRKQKPTKKNLLQPATGFTTADSK